VFQAIPIGGVAAPGPVAGQPSAKP
jgi:hypothetical protein